MTYRVDANKVRGIVAAWILDPTKSFALRQDRKEPIGRLYVTNFWGNAGDYSNLDTVGCIPVKSGNAALPAAQSFRLKCPESPTSRR